MGQTMGSAELGRELAALAVLIAVGSLLALTARR